MDSFNLKLQYKVRPNRIEAKADKSAVEYYAVLWMDK